VYHSQRSHKLKGLPSSTDIALAKNKKSRPRCKISPSFCILSNFDLTPSAALSTSKIHKVAAMAIVPSSKSLALSLKPCFLTLFIECSLSTMPPEIHKEIFSHLGAVESVCLGLTCKNYYQIHKEFHGIVSLRSYSERDADGWVFTLGGLLTWGEDGRAGYAFSISHKPASLIEKKRS